MIYCCAPISGRSYADVITYYTKLKSDLEKIGLDPLIPMVRKDHENDPSLPAHGLMEPGSTDKAITNRDRWLVKQSGLVYANLLGSNSVSIGTCMELAWAYDAGIHVILAMEKDNIHSHSFINTSADVIYENHEDAILYIKELADNLIQKTKR